MFPKLDYCPHCNAFAEFAVAERPGGLWVYVRCTMCEASTKRIKTGARPSMVATRKAAKLWNRRHQPDSLDYTRPKASRLATVEAERVISEGPRLSLKELMAAMGPKPRPSTSR